MRFAPIALWIVLSASTTTAFVGPNNFRPHSTSNHDKFSKLKYKIIDPSKSSDNSSPSQSSSSMNAGSGIGFGAGDNLSNQNAGAPEKEYKSELVARWEKEQAEKGGGGGGSTPGGFGSGANGVPGFGAPSGGPPPPSSSGGGGGGSTPGGFGSGANGVPGFGAPSGGPPPSSSSSSSGGSFGSGANGVPGFGAPSGGSTSPSIGGGGAGGTPSFGATASASSSSSFQSPTAATGAGAFTPGNSSPTPGMNSMSSSPMGGGMGAPMGSSSSSMGMGGSSSMPPPMSSSSMPPPMNTFTPPSTGGSGFPPPQTSTMPPMNSMPPPMMPTDPNAAGGQNNNNNNQQQAGPVYTQEPGTNGLDLDTNTPELLDMPVYNEYDDADIPGGVVDEYDDPRDDFDDRRAGYEMELEERQALREEQDLLQAEEDETLSLMEENRRLKEQLMRARQGGDTLPYEGRLVARTDEELRNYQREQEQSSPHYGIEMRRARKRAQDIQRRHDWDAKNALLEGNFELPGEKLIQGQTLLTWSFMSPAIRRVQCYLSTEGRPIDAQVELWDGPDNIPHKMKVYTESGYEHPFNAIIQTPGGWNTLAVKNTGSMDFPLKATCEGVDPREPTLGYIDPTDARTQGPQTVQGGALRSYTFDASVSSIQLLIKTQGRPIQCKIELIQGPNNNKQVIDLYTQNGQTYPFYAILETLGRGSVIRIINEAPIEFPITATAAPYKISYRNDDVLPTIR